MLETDLFLFVDTLFASLILPIRSEMVLPAMLIFGHSQISIFIIAFLASTIGLVIDWQIGKWLGFIKKALFSDKQKEILKLENFWNKYLIWLIPIAAFSPIGPVFCLFCGFFKTRWQYLLILIGLGRFAYYCHLALSF